MHEIVMAGVGVLLHALLTVAQDKGELLASRPGRFIPAKDGPQSWSKCRVEIRKIMPLSNIVGRTDRNHVNYMTLYLNFKHYEYDMI
jgi:hypothetical protein